MASCSSSALKSLSMDLFVAPTLGFDLLYAFIIVRLARRDLVWINVTPHPTADWIARQITEAFPWNEAPRYHICDRDQVYGVAVRHRLRAMGIRRFSGSGASRRMRSCSVWITTTCEAEFSVHIFFFKQKTAYEISAPKTT